MRGLTAEILAIGDEMIGGSRLDTNTQFLARQLSEIGVQVVFHTTVGDDEARQVDVFQLAASRVDLVIATGGLGPTADDLTRNVLAKVMNVELRSDDATVEHIRSLFRRYRREMPESNLVQANFPNGSRIIPNPEGTAPGIDAEVNSRDRCCRFFCLPGVPAEMHEMWNGYVRPEICKMSGGPQVIETYVINCFGSGESHIESLLGDLIARGRDPVVGITASQAVISLRLVASGESSAACAAKTKPTADFIRERLGDLVFGEGDETLEDVVVRELDRRKETLAILDFGLNGDVASALSKAQSAAKTAGFMGGSLRPKGCAQCNDAHSLDSFLADSAKEFRLQNQADWGLAISSIQTKGPENREFFRAVLTNGDRTLAQEFPHTGHSALRHTRSVKQVLNFLRLSLQS
jgi:nicotinamide-nucleotide amidase